MKEDIRIKITSESEAAIIGKALDQLGFRSSGGGENYIKNHLAVFGNNTWDYLLLHFQTMRLNACADCKYHNEPPLHDFSSFMSLIAKDISKPAPPKIMIGEHAVQFKKGGVQVGCTFVPRETVNQIHARLN